MKKILIILALVLMVCGCSQQKQQILNDSDTVLFKVAGEEYTKGDLYDQLIASSGTNAALAELKVKIAEKEGIDFGPMNEEAQSYYDYIVSLGDEYVESLGGEDYIKQSYIKAYLIDNAISKNYILKNIEDYFEDYKPYKAQVVYYDTEEDAKLVIDEVKAGEKFEFAAVEVGYSQEPTAQIYTERSTDLNGQVRAYCSDDSVPLGISSVIVSSTETTDADGNSIATPRYFVVNIISKDMDEIKEEFADHMIEKQYIDAKMAFNMTLKDHDINIYNQVIYDNLVETYEALGNK